jgi:HAD superfamily hydrolase (TIGR01509 family)
MHPELQCFESLLLSCELGLAKPDPEIFVQACRIAGAAPARCFFIDDTRANVEAARAIGLQTHWFRGVNALKRELAHAGTQGM